MTKHRNTAAITTAALASVLYAVATPALHAEPSRVKAMTLNIASQPLAEALTEFGKQSGLQVILYSSVAKKSTTTRLAGQFTPAAALDLLLADTGLRYEYLDAETVAVLSSTQQLEKPAASIGTANVNLTMVNASVSAQEMRGETVPDGSPVSSETDKSRVEEIVVTAQKRKELLQDVPISITVLSGEKLDKSSFAGITDALKTMPGVAIDVEQYSGGLNLSLRGVSNYNASSGGRLSGSSPVAYYVDGVPFGFVRSAIYPADSSVYDLQQIELLRGPQGTLYGANAMNGVLRILTQDADPDAFAIKARTALSTTKGGGENHRGDLMINVPIVEGRLAVRGTVGYRNDSGWIDAPNADDVNDAEGQNYRLKINARPTDSLTIDLSAWRARNEIGAPSLSNDAGRITSVEDQSDFEEFSAYGLEINQDFSAFSISSMTSYVDYKNAGIVDGSPVRFLATLATELDASIFSEEINIVSNLDGPWRWSAGAFYRDAEDTYYQLLDYLPPDPRIILNNDFTDTSESVAVYGEIGRRLHDELELSFGLRYFRDKQSNRINQQYPPPGQNIPFTPFKGTSDAVTPRAVLTWTPTPAQTVYASYSQGFRSGFVQQPNVRVNAPDFAPVEPDKLSNYEVGSKGSVLDGRMSYEAAVYYIDWQDIQQGVTVFLSTGLTTSAMVNGQSASGLGAEFSVTARPFGGLGLGASVSWNDLTFDGDVYTGTSILFRKGDRLNFSPECTVGASAQYDFPLGAGGFTGTLELSGNYKSPQRTAAVGAVFRGESLLTTGVRFSIAAPDHWSATLYADNLNNESGTTKDLTAVATRDWNPRFRPRTVGLQLEYNFK